MIRAFNLKHVFAWICCFFLSTCLLADNRDSLLHELKILKNDTGKVRAYISLSAVYLKADYDSALYYAKKAKNLAEKLHDKVGVSRSYLRAGNAYNYKGIYDSATWAYTKALKMFEEQKDYDYMGKALNNLGLMYRYKQDYPESVNYFMQALKLKKAHGLAKDVGIGYNNLGIVYAIQGEYEKAEKYFLDANEIHKKSGDSSLYYANLIDLSTMYRETNRIEESQKNLLAAKAFHKRNGNKTSEATCIYNMGTGIQSVNPLKSLEYYKEARQIFSELGNKVRLTGCNLRISTVLFETGQFAEAEKECKLGVEIFDSLHAPFQEYKFYDLLYKINKTQGDFEEALFYKENYQNILDSITKEEHDLKIIELETNYQKELNTHEINQLRRKQQVKNLILIGIVLIVLLMALTFYSRTKTKKRLNDDLRAKNEIIQNSLEEKEVLLREIHHRVQNNLQFVSSLLNLQARRVEDLNTVTVLKDCRLRIQSMALIHQKLYQEHNLKGIDFQKYTQNLLDSLVSSYQIDTKYFKSDLLIEPMLLDINTSISIGLILNELITNVFKYAFENRVDGLLTISLNEINSKLHLVVQDNGIGIEDNFTIDNSPSFGLKLVHSLALKLDAEVKVSSNEGTRVEIIIKKYDKA